MARSGDRFRAVNRADSRNSVQTHRKSLETARSPAGEWIEVERVRESHEDHRQIQRIQTRLEQPRAALSYVHSNG
jgi:hypothetical protein